MTLPALIQPLDSLHTSVTEILRGLKGAGPEFDSTVKLVQAALDALGTAGTIVRHHDDALTPAEAARYLAWLHELRSPVQVMAGWGRMLRGLDSEAKRARARDVIERNAHLLVERLLVEPPGPGGPFIPKPFHLQEFLDTVARLIGQTVGRRPREA